LNISILKIPEKPEKTKPDVPFLKLGKPEIPILKFGKSETVDNKLKKTEENPLKIEELSPPPAKKPSIPALKIGFLTQDPEKKKTKRKNSKKPSWKKTKKLLN
jgi:hypothetical protein